MTDYRCSQCGIRSLPSPDSAGGPQTCRHCGGQVVAVLPPPSQGPGAARPVRRRYGAGAWVLFTVAAIAVPVAAYFALAGPSEPKALTRSRGWVPLSKLATPVRVQIAASQRGRRVYLSLRMADARGEGIRLLKLAGGRRPDLPEVSILDSEGSVVYRCKLSYG